MEAEVKLDGPVYVLCAADGVKMVDGELIADDPSGVAIAPSVNDRGEVLMGTPSILVFTSRSSAHAFQGDDKDVKIATFLGVDHFLAFLRDRSAHGIRFAAFNKNRATGGATYVPLQSVIEAAGG